MHGSEERRAGFEFFKDFQRWEVVDMDYVRGLNIYYVL
jgi:hypothetical protein